MQCTTGEERLGRVTIKVTVRVTVTSGLYGGFGVVRFGHIIGLLPCFTAVTDLALLYF